MTTVATVRVASRVVCGTEWPIEYTVERWHTASGKPRWTVVKHLCQGIPQGTEDFTTRKAALARLTELTKED
jgi:hypothetical protein